MRPHDSAKLAAHLLIPAIRALATLLCMIAFFALVIFFGAAFS